MASPTAPDRSQKRAQSPDGSSSPHGAKKHCAVSPRTISSTEGSSESLQDTSDKDVENIPKHPFGWTPINWPHPEKWKLPEHIWTHLQQSDEESWDDDTFDESEDMQDSVEGMVAVPDILAVSVDDTVLGRQRSLSPVQMTPVPESALLASSTPPQIGSSSPKTHRQDYAKWTPEGLETLVQGLRQGKSSTTILRDGSLSQRSTKSIYNQIRRLKYMKVLKKNDDGTWE